MKRSETVFTAVSVPLFQSKTSLAIDQKVKDCDEMKRVASAVEKVAEKAIGRQEGQTEFKEVVVN